MAEWEEEYEEEEDPSSKGMKAQLLQWAPFILIALFFFIFRGRLGILSADKAMVWSISAVISITMYKYMMAWVKNITPKFVFNPGWDITDGEYETVGNYAMLRPGIKYLNIKFKSPVYITPIDTMHKLGKNLVSPVLMEMSTIEELPLEARSHIIEKGYKPPYYYGEADVEQYSSEVDDMTKASGFVRPKVGFLVTSLKEAHKTIAMLQSALQGKMNVAEDLVDFGKRVSAREESLYEKIKKSIIEKEGG